MGFEAFQVKLDGLSDVGEGLLERVAFGMAARQRGAEGVVTTVGLFLQNRRVSHAHESTLPRRRRPYNPAVLRWASNLLCGLSLLIFLLAMGIWVRWDRISCSLPVG